MVESKLVPSLRFNQKGQGMIEYVLLLVITVTMILLALSNLFKPMQAFLQNYMGTYVACLLSSGELPAIRTDNNLKDSDPKCNFSFTAGTAKMTVNGSNYTGSSGGPGSNGSGSNGSGGSNGTGNDGKDSNGKNKSSNGDGNNVDGSGNGSGNSYAGSRSRRSGFGNSSSRRRSSDSSSVGDDGAGGDRKRYVNNLDRNGNDRFFRAQQKTRSGGERNGRGIALSGLTEEEQKKIERKVQASPRAVPKSSEEFSVPGKKSIVQPPPMKKQKLTEDEEESTGIGGFLKYLIIAAIILLILILGGGQAFEMSKSMD